MEEGPITAVWGPPGQTQINVCRACLEEKIRLGEWEVRGKAPGARLSSAIQQRAEADAADCRAGLSRYARFPALGSGLLW